MKNKIMTIRIHPDPILRKKSKEVKVEEIKNEDFQNFLINLEKTMLEKDGAGLASPQVGILKRVVVINNKGKNIFMINPKITKLSYGQEIQEEGCLSVVDENNELYYKPISRHKWLNCNYYNEKGKLKKIKAKGILARAIQHEIDHLNGILFIDYLK
jgi:peptide deformylase